MRKLDISKYKNPSYAIEEDEGISRIAILVIHGIGQQNPLETMDQFVRGLRQALNTSYYPENSHEYSVSHRQVDYISSQQQEPWLENHIALEANIEGKIDKTKPIIDVYEYYWAHHMTGQTNVSDILTWFKEVTSYARRYYREKSKNWSEEQKQQFTGKRKEDACLKNLFEPDGQFHKNGYLRNLGWLLRIAITIHEFLKDSVFKSWPFIRMLYERISRKVNEWLVDYVGDVVIYTTMDRKAQHYEIRNNILRGARFEVEGLLSNKAYDSILIAGHSLGSVIAYDLISRLHTAPATKEDAEEWRGSLARIKGLITFGSPLDKIGFFFREQVKKDAHIRRQMLNNLHGFKKNPLDDPDVNSSATGYVKVQNDAEKNLDHVKWINFYDRKDPVSGHLDLYEVDDNKEFQMGASFGTAHVKYWEYQPMYAEILSFFDQEIKPTARSESA